jgi:hypothetical protein
MKENEMGGTCSTLAVEGKCIGSKVMDGELERK